MADSLELSNEKIQHAGYQLRLVADLRLYDNVFRGRKVIAGPVEVERRGFRDGLRAVRGQRETVTGPRRRRKRFARCPLRPLQGSMTVNPSRPGVHEPVHGQ